MNKQLAHIKKLNKEEIKSKDYPNKKHTMAKKMGKSESEEEKHERKMKQRAYIFSR